MDKDVFVRVKGSFTGPTDGEDIELIAPGQYFLRNGAQYVLYDEMDEALGEPIKNTIKITPDKISLRKRGPVVADMSFESGEERVATYTTPFGSLVLNVLARNMVIHQTEDELNIKLDLLTKDTKMTFNNITFEVNSAELNTESYTELNRIIEFLTLNNNVKIELSAHTDDLGSDWYNLRLSEKRAQAAAKYLIDKGIKEDQLVAKGYGETTPVVPNTSDENRAQNRRVEIKIIE